MRYFSIVIMFLASIALAQPVEIVWQNTIGGDNNDWNRITLPTSDGGFLIGGFSDSDISGDKTENNVGDSDYWVLKLDETGSIVWQNSIGGVAIDQLWSIIESGDGGYLLVGSSESNISGDKTENTIGSLNAKDYWIVKINATGVIEWDNTIGGDEQEEAFIARQTLDGGFLIGGWSISDISGDKTENSNGFRDWWIVKIDNSGVIQWQNTIGGSSGDQLRDLTVNQDGSFTLFGSSLSDISGDKSENSKGESDIWVVKVNELGEVLWDKTIGGSGFDDCFSAVSTFDGGYTIAGRSSSGISGDKSEPTYGNIDIWLVKIDANGNVLWENTIGGMGDDQIQSSNSLVQTSDGGFLIGGQSDSNIGVDKSEDSRGWSDYWIIKTDVQGEILWDKTIGGDNVDYTRSLLQTQNGNIVIGGRSGSSISGEKDEDIIGGMDYWVLELSPTLNVLGKELSEAIISYTNPVNDLLNYQAEGFTIDKINVLDVSGRLISTIQPTDLNVDMSHLNAGTYMVEFVSGEFSTVKKIIKK